MAMFDPMNGDCIAGYTKAICDIREIFKYIQGDLKHHHKLMGPKMVDKLLGTILDWRREIREDRGFIRWNDKKEAFEWFPGKEK